MRILAVVLVGVFGLAASPASALTSFDARTFVDTFCTGDFESLFDDTIVGGNASHDRACLIDTEGHDITFQSARVTLSDRALVILATDRRSTISFFNSTIRANGFITSPTSEEAVIGNEFKCNRSNFNLHDFFDWGDGIIVIPTLPEETDVSGVTGAAILSRKQQINQCNFTDTDGNIIAVLLAAQPAIYFD